VLPLRDATPTTRTPVITLGILAACVVAFGYELLVLVQGGDPALNRLITEHGLIPADLVAATTAGNLASGALAGLLSHMFLHASWLHLMGNALFLWIFGPRVEGRLGRARFLAFYLLGGLAAAAGHVLADPTSEAPMIGASGAISAVLGGYVVLFPRARIQSLVFLVFFYELIAVPSVVVLGFWFALQLIDGFASLGLTAEASGGIAFWAHVGGFVAGLLMTLPLRLLGRLGPGATEAIPAAAPAAVPGPPPGPPSAPPPAPPPPPTRR
jgi:membrane associated rhomboid family serine protease